MRPAAVVPALLLLAGCASDEGAYPSLASRPAERLSFAEPAVTPLTAAATDPALDAQLAQIGGRLDAIVRGYDADSSRAERAAGMQGAGSVGSEAWVAAQTALAALDDWRAQAGGIATELDGLARTRVETAGTDYPALDALRQRAEAESEREAAGIAALGAKVPTP